MALTKCNECDQAVSTAAYTCPHCGAPQRAAPPPILPAFVVQHAPEKKKGMGIFSGCLVVILVLIIIGFIGSIVVKTVSTGGSALTDIDQKEGSRPQNGESGMSSTFELTARVRFTGTQIAIQNGDIFDWTNVKLEINSGLLSGGFVLNEPRMSAGQEYTVGTMQFAKSGGERFNPLTHKPQKFTIWCDTPKGKGFYYGEWK